MFNSNSTPPSPNADAEAKLNPEEPSLGGIPGANDSNHAIKNRHEALHASAALEVEEVNEEVKPKAINYENFIDIIADTNSTQMVHQMLEEELTKDYIKCFNFLVSNFANETIAEGSRQQLGFYIKHIIHSEDPGIKKAKKDLWLKSPSDHQRAVREIFLQVLQSPVQGASKAAAQLIGAYGSVELRDIVTCWPELIPSIIANGSTTGVASHIVANSLYSIGLIFECSESTKSEGPPLGLEDMNSIITMIIRSIGGSRPEDIQCAALESLNHSVNFASQNFENDAERDAIINSIIELLTSPSREVKEKAFGCLAAIIESHYDYMAAYIPAISEVSLTVIATDLNDDVAKRALQLWCTISEVEGKIIDDLEDEGVAYESFTRNENFVYLHLIEAAAESFIPFLLKQLGRIDVNSIETLDDSLGMSAVDLLSHFQSICYDKYAKVAIDFIQTSAKSEEIPIQFSYITALGLLSNPLQPKRSYGLIDPMSQLLIQGLKSTHPIIRSQSAWSIAQVFGIYSPDFFNDSLLDNYITSLAQMLQADPPEHPNVIQTVCLSFQELFLNSVFEEEKSDVVAPYIAGLMQAFYAATKAFPDSPKVQESLFEAIANLISATPFSQIQIVVQTLHMTISSLQETLSQPSESRRYDYRSSLIGTISNCCKAIVLVDQNTYQGNGQSPLLTDLDGKVLLADAVMSTLFKILTDTKLSNIHEESMIVFGYVAGSLQGDFMRYCTERTIFQLVFADIQSFEDNQILAQIALNAAGDIFKAMKLNLTHEICEPFMTAVSIIFMPLCNITSVKMRDVNCTAIAFCGDVCDANPDLFLSSYAPMVFDIITKVAARIQIDDEADKYFVEYVSELREQIMLYFSIVVDALGNMHNEEVIENHCDLMFQIIFQISDDWIKYGDKFGSMLDKEVFSALGLVGDIAKYMKQRCFYYVDDPKVKLFLLKAETSFSFKAYKAEDDNQNGQLFQYTQQQLVGVKPTSEHKLVWAASMMLHLFVFHEFRGTQVVVDLFEFLG